MNLDQRTSMGGKEEGLIVTQLFGTATTVQLYASLEEAAWGKLACLCCQIPYPVQRDGSSVRLRIDEVENETFRADRSMEGLAPQDAEISMPPKRRRFVQVQVKHRERGEPNVVWDAEFTSSPSAIGQMPPKRRRLVKMEISRRRKGEPPTVDLEELM